MITRFKFSTQQVPDLHPVEAMRSLFGPVNISADDEQPIDFSVNALILPQVQISSQTSSPFCLETDAALADPNILSLTMSQSGGGLFTTRNNEEEVRDGTVLVHPLEGGMTGRTLSPARWHSVRISHAMIAPLLSRDTSRHLRTVPFSFPAVGLLNHYVAGLLGSDNLVIDGMEALVADHIRDLVALIVGANGESRHQAMSGGVAAARLEAAKDFIRINLLQPDLSDQMIGLGLGLSPSYIRKLFTPLGGLHGYVTKQRLVHAHRLLSSARYQHLKVIEIAFRCGFSSLATFNRQFRAQYDISPTEARLAFLDQQKFASETALS